MISQKGLLMINGERAECKKEKKKMYISNQNRLSGKDGRFREMKTGKAKRVIPVGPWPGFEEASGVGQLRERGWPAGVV